MKKVIYFAALLVGMSFASCEKEDVENTATVSMAGQWYVDIDAVDEGGSPIAGGEHYFGWDEERMLLLTYNTADNKATEMIVDDIGNFDVASYYGNQGYPNYSLKSKVSINLDNLTFSSSGAQNLSAVNGYNSALYAITIEDGKILKGTGRQNNGSPADSIVFYVRYANDPWYPDDGYAKYKVSGIRYSGLAEND
jgi:hypothetical protein